MKKGKLILALIILGVFIYSISLFLKDGQLARPQLIKVDKTFSSLDETVSNFLRGTQGTYAVVIKNISTGKGYYLNKDMVFEPGSLYKLWVMGTVYKAMQKGEIQDDEILTEDIKVLNQKFEIDENSTELTEGEISMSVSDALNQMITISHNFAALLLTDRIKNSKIKEFLQTYGFKDSDIGTPPKTTASDIALFYEKLYKKELINEEYSQKMIDLLKKQELNDGLPKYLPKDTVIAHKTGDIGWFKHDGGIVFTPEGDYIIVVLSESSSPLGAQDRIAQISKGVYDYFNK